MYVIGLAAVLGGDVQAVVLNECDGTYSLRYVPNAGRHDPCGANEILDYSKVYGLEELSSDIKQDGFKVRKYIASTYLDLVNYKGNVGKLVIVGYNPEYDMYDVLYSRANNENDISLYNLSQEIMAAVTLNSMIKSGGYRVCNPRERVGDYQDIVNFRYRLDYMQGKTEAAMLRLKFKLVGRGGVNTSSGVFELRHTDAIATRDEMIYQEQFIPEVSEDGSTQYLNIIKGVQVAKVHLEHYPGCKKIVIINHSKDLVYFKIFSNTGLRESDYPEELKIVSPESEIRNISRMLVQSRFKYIDLSEFHTKEIYDATRAFYANRRLKKIDVSGMTFDDGACVYELFNGCASIKEIAGMEVIDRANVSCREYMFESLCNT